MSITVYNEQMKSIRNRWVITASLCYTLVVVGSFLAISAALFMQHGKGLQPCTMCIIQRYAFVLMGLSALFSLIVRFWPVRFLLLLVGLLGAMGGVIAAIRNLWVLSHPEILCGRDPIEIFLNNLPTAQWVPKVFVALGLCSDPIPPLLGLPLPAWSLIGLLLMSALLLRAIRR